MYLRNRYVYGLNNPVRYVDPTGNVAGEAMVCLLILTSAGTYYVAYVSTRWIMRNRHKIAGEIIAVGRTIDEALSAGRVITDVCPVYGESNATRIEADEGGSEAGEETEDDSYYKKGRPEGGNPTEDTLKRKDKADVKSEDFKEFLEEQGHNPKKWKKIMETWETPDGDLYERHYWTDGVNSYYHN